MKKSQPFLIILLICSFGFAIQPPAEGNFPPGFWEKMKSKGIGENYGDPGWIKKINQWKMNPNRDTQLEFYIPVLMGTHSDSDGTFFEPADYQEQLFGDNETGNVQEYYDEISYGNFYVDGSVYGWYQSSTTHAEAVDNAKPYVAEIAELADSDVDYSQFDNDGPDNVPNSGDDDGYVDGLMVIYPGCFSGEDNIWPHMSSLGDYAYVTNDASANGGTISISTYCVMPERAGSSNCSETEMHAIGVYCHEFGHVLGLPDLYDRDSDNNGDSNGIGHWCLMASGSWRGDSGTRPTHMSAWCKIQMGWMQATVVENDETNVEIPQIESNPFALKIWEDDYYFSRYFLVENRQTVGFDDDIHGPGLLIYHINENRRYGADNYSSGSCNDNEDDKLIDVEEADGDNDLDDDVNRGDDGDPFPGSSENTTFDDNSYPAATRNDGTETGISVTNISDPDSIMTADIIVRPQYGYGLAYDELGISSYGFGNSTPSDKWAGVLFTAEEEGYLTEVDFGVRYSGSYWTAYIYDSFDGLDVYSENLVDSTTGYSEHNDWVTVTVDSVPIETGQDFFVAVKYHDETYSVCFDKFGDLSYRSYYSTDGVAYADYISDYGDVNIRAKVSTDAFVGIDPSATVPQEMRLFPNYPNPFNPKTTFSFNIGSEQQTSLGIYDIQGRLVEELIKDKIKHGLHQITWDGNGFASGIYFAKLRSGEKVKTQKIMLLK